MILIIPGPLRRSCDTKLRKRRGAAVGERQPIKDALQVTKAR